MPAPSYRWLTCDADGALYEWRYKPRYRNGRWDRLPVERWVTCRPVSPTRAARLRAQGVRIPEPGGIVDMEGAQ